MTFEVKTERSYRREIRAGRKISRKQIEVSSRKNSIGNNTDALAFKEINRSLLKVDKNQKIGNRTFGNCYIALYRNECRVVAKEMKIIEPPKKTREEEWREASAVTRIGDHWGIPLLFGVCTDRAPFQSNNVVIDGSENKPVIIDFGKSCKIVKARLRKPKVIEKSMKKFPHIAPEIHRGERQSIASDVFSFGYLVTRSFRNSTSPEGSG